MMRGETRRIPGLAAGCNKPATLGAEKTVEVVQNHEDGTRDQAGSLIPNRRTGNRTVAEWTPESMSMEGRWSRFARSRRPTAASAAARRRGVPRHGAQGSAMVPTAHGRGSHRERDRGSRAAHPLRKQTGPRNPAGEAGLLRPGDERHHAVTRPMEVPDPSLLGARGRAEQADAPPAMSGRTPTEAANPESLERPPETERRWRARQRPTSRYGRPTSHPFTAPL